MSEHTYGNLMVRPNELQRGDVRPRHEHYFPHLTLLDMGWALVRATHPSGEEVVFQLATAEHAEVRRLLAAYEPERLPRPVRFPDTTYEDGRAKFDVRFIAQGEPVPEGGEEITFQPLASLVNIMDSVQHEFCALAPTRFICAYSHRLPQKLLEMKPPSPEFEAKLAELIKLANEAHADIVQHPTGWPAAYSEVGHG